MIYTIRIFPDCEGDICYDKSTKVMAIILRFILLWFIFMSVCLGLYFDRHRSLVATNFHRHIEALMGFFSHVTRASFLNHNSGHQIAHGNQNNAYESFFE